MGYYSIFFHGSRSLETLHHLAGHHAAPAVEKVETAQSTQPVVPPEEAEQNHQLRDPTEDQHRGQPEHSEDAEPGEDEAVQEASTPAEKLAEATARAEAILCQLEFASLTRENGASFPGEQAAQVARGNPAYPGGSRSTSSKK